jgi:MFS family permease
MATRNAGARTARGEDRYQLTRGTLFAAALSAGNMASPVLGGWLAGFTFDALGHANAIGYVVCGVAGLVAALLVVLALGGGAHRPMITERSLAEQDEAGGSGH